MSNQEINNAEQCVSCSFCNEKFSPSAIGEHLMMCGNKTDQCPNCRKYIRRAIFAYHYENNCAKLDELDGEVNAVTIKKPDNSLTLEPNNPSQTSSSVIPKDDKHIMVVRVEVPTTTEPQPATSRRLDSDFCESKKIIVKCSYCNQQCEIGERNIHQENCLQNPDNIRKKQSSRTNGASNQNSDGFNYDNQFDDTDKIPCELCNEPIEWRHFDEHVKACIEREHERMRNQPRPTNVTNENSYARCRHCNEACSWMTLRIHEIACTKHPRRIALDAWWKRPFQRPSLTMSYPIPYYPFQ